MSLTIFCALTMHEEIKVEPNCTYAYAAHYRPVLKAANLPDTFG
jgi:hypothetical protein